MIAKIALVLGIITLDRLVKHYVFTNFALGEMRSFLPGLMDLTYHQNTGMAFSFLNNHQWVPTLMAPLLIIGLGIALARGAFPSKIQQYSLLAIMAGGFSNWMSRIMYGFVVDMFSFAFVRFAVFNVADIFITCAAVLFGISYVMEERKRKKDEKEMEVSDG